MRVALISPYSGIEATGLRILSACLKEAGFETRMLFLPDVAEAMAGTHYGTRRLPPDVVQQIVALCADAALVGITVMTPSVLLARLLTRHLRRSLDVPVIWGGVHPTLCPAESLADADLVCVGEGEQTIVELARRIADGADYTGVPGIGYRREDGEAVVNPPYPLQTNLDALPFPDYDFAEHYVLHEGEMLPFSQDLMHYYLTDLGSWASGPVYGVLTTRGCPYSCTYCANDALGAIYPTWHKLRRRSPQNVIAEIQTVRRRLPLIEGIILRDDTFLANPEPYIAEFSRLYRREVNLPFRAYTTAQTATAAKLQPLVEAGLRYVIMGIQTGSKETQKLYRRNVSNQKMLAAARLIHRFREAIPRPMYDVITDNPYETDEDRYQTLRLIHQLPPPYRLSLFSLTFYPGTHLHHKAKADGLLDADGLAKIYTYNFQIVKANYYNLALFCHSLNLPRPLLAFLVWRPVFNLLRRGLLNRLCGWVLKGLLALRLYRNRRLYARRKRYWLARYNLSDGN